MRKDIIVVNACKEVGGSMSGKAAFKWIKWITIIHTTKELTDRGVEISRKKEKKRTKKAHLAYRSDEYMSLVPIDA